MCQTWSRLKSLAIYVDTASRFLQSGLEGDSAGRLGLEANVLYQKAACDGGFLV